MSNATFIIGSTGGQINLSKVTTPDTPPNGYVGLYAQNVGGTDTIRGIDSNGDIISFSGGGSGSNGTSGINGSSGTSGTSGTSGSGFNWEGGWVNSITYFVKDTVIYNGSTWVALTTISPGGSAPDINPNWDLVAAAGTSGTSGINGSSGTSGAVGATGSSGTSGVNGANGSSGTSGVNGATGAAGSTFIVVGSSGGRLLTASGTGGTGAVAEANLTYNSATQSLAVGTGTVTAAGGVTVGGRTYTSAAISTNVSGATFTILGGSGDGAAQLVIGQGQNMLFRTLSSNSRPGILNQGSMIDIINTLTVTGGATLMNFALANNFLLTLPSGTSTTINIFGATAATNAGYSGDFFLRITQGATGSGTVSFPSYVKQIGTPYTPTATANAVDILQFKTFDTTQVYLVSAYKDFV